MATTTDERAKKVARHLSVRSVGKLHLFPFQLAPYALKLDLLHKSTGYQSAMHFNPKSPVMRLSKNYCAMISGADHTTVCIYAGTV